MDYNNRFKKDNVRTSKYKTEDLMVDFINENNIEIIQIYTTIANYRFDEGSRIEHNFHLMYKIIPDVEKTMI